MEYITLKNTDIKVSRLCMGGCPMGQYGWGAVQEQELLDMDFMPSIAKITKESIEPYRFNESDTECMKRLLDSFSRNYDVVIFDKQGRRDRLFENKGSYYAMPVTFYNNQEALVEAILLISSYGRNFVPLPASANDENEFKKIMAYEVLPYYISIIQNELAALYLRHNLEKMHCIKNPEYENTFHTRRADMNLKQILQRWVCK
ncbi:MAG: hypothetical protein LUI14_15870 [Lachnospiraceae bacterium]|nr:hypothetical protein [Lachnospiraceae bacterium]